MNKVQRKKTRTAKASGFGLYSEKTFLVHGVIQFCSSNFHNIDFLTLKLKLISTFQEYPLNALNYSLILDKLA
ncbi:MAG: hypothetical protein EBU82_01590 [Flavobacteriia bacterium]|nr:hypothetical protein [Flavobacteriia bacterium]NBP27988.1 hypothetical protein [Flavobacteriia bacterium]